MSPPADHWYAVHTHARMEIWARSNLWQRGLEVYLPLYRRQRRHARKVDWVDAPLFPRYLFVAASPGESRQRAIDSAPGVVGVVRFGERAALVPGSVIGAIQAREDASGRVQLVDRDSLTPGDRVRLHSGAMAEHVGLFERRGDGDRVVILLHLLGREIRVKVPTDAIAPML